MARSSFFWPRPWPLKRASPGEFYPRNLRKAVALLKTAADADHPDACYDLAVCHEEGGGVRKNAGKALALHMKAALLGEPQSVYEVGRCHYHGIGVKRDRRLAHVWLDGANALGVN